MSIPIETLVGWGGTLAVIAGKHAVDSYRTSRSEKEIEEIWKWKNIYEKEATNFRTEVQVQISELKGNGLVINEKLASILMKLQEILDRIIALENYKNGR